MTKIYRNAFIAFAFTTATLLNGNVAVALSKNNTLSHLNNITAAHKSSFSNFININVDSLCRSLIDSHPESPISGIWKTTTDMATVAILPSTDWNRYTRAIPEEAIAEREDAMAIIIISSPDPFIQPGTIMGWIWSSAKKNHFHATLFTKTRKGKLTKPKRFVLQLNDDGHLAMWMVNKGIKFSPWHFLPYSIHGVSLRNVIRYTDDTPKDMDGFIKIWPTPLNPHSPRYL